MNRSLVQTVLPHLHSGREEHYAEQVSPMQVAEDRVHGLLQLRDLATAHGAADVQHKDHVFPQWRQVFRSEEVDKVAVTYL
jgi:hypothetical protein